jgi:hypothetical protein
MKEARRRQPSQSNDSPSSSSTMRVEEHNECNEVVSDSFDAAEQVMTAAASYL